MTERVDMRFRRKVFAAFVQIIAITYASVAVSDDLRAVWTIVVHPKDIVIGKALSQLHTRYAWRDGFDDQSGDFEVALRKTAIAIPAPHCRMDYLILKIPFYYPENPKQASTSERRSIFDDLLRFHESSSGSATMIVEAPQGLARVRSRRVELVGCNIYFAFPLSVQVSAQ